jgi:hypothetical protein
MRLPEIEIKNCYTPRGSTKRISVDFDEYAKSFVPGRKKNCVVCFAISSAGGRLNDWMTNQGKTKFI